MYRIGIDLGGTKVEGIVIDENNEELHRKRMPNGREGGYDVVINNIASLYKEIRPMEDTLDHAALSDNQGFSY